MGRSGLPKQTVRTMPDMKQTAVAYYRTSSATNVGADKDSLKRQQDAVQAYATGNGLTIVREFYDPAVSGADPVMDRPGFADMLAYMLGNGARTVLCESASRFVSRTRPGIDARVGRSR